MGYTQKIRAKQCRTHLAEVDTLTPEVLKMAGAPMPPTHRGMAGE